MYLLSPEGKTVFIIPGVEIVHTLPASVKLPVEPVKKDQIEEMDGKMQPPSQQGGKKRQNLTLDLNSASSKKSRVQNLLTSPDVQMLKLTSPELEKFLNQNPTLATPTPSGYIFPKSVTEEQMMYAKGFEEALEHLRSAETIVTSAPTIPSDPPPPPPPTTFNINTTLTSLKNVAPTTLVIPSVPSASFPHNTSLAPRTSLVMPELPTEPVILPPSVLPSRPLSRPSSGASGSYDGSESYHAMDGIKIKDEPSDDASISGGESQPGFCDRLSPIDMESQEKIKLERKRLRNRQAATKCRKRKLERISQLDGRVQQLKEENGDLVAVVKKLKANVAMLKQEVIEHVNHGCEILTNEETTFS